MSKYVVCAFGAEDDAEPVARDVPVEMADKSMEGRVAAVVDDDDDDDADDFDEEEDNKMADSSS